MKWRISRPGMIRLTHDHGQAFSDLFRYLTLLTQEIQSALDQTGDALPNRDKAGSWTISRYEDGRAEAETEVRLTVSSMQSWGNLYFAEGVAALPQGLFVRPFSAAASPLSSTGGARFWSAVFPTEQQTDFIRFAAISAENVSKQTEYVMRLVVNGRWK